MNYELPKTVNVNGTKYDIRSDYRAILDICTALSDADLKEGEKAHVALIIFYPDYLEIPSEDEEKALEELFKFINLGEMDTNVKNRPKLVDWEQDFKYIIAPINRAAGMEVRSVEYMHWWTFMGFYNDIDGDSTFSFIVRIRDKKRRGKKLDETEKRFYRENQHLVDFQRRYTDTEDELLKKWTNG